MYKATLVQAKSENMTVSVKTISKYKSQQETTDFLHEMRVVMDLMHPNIVHIHGIVDQGEHMEQNVKTIPTIFVPIISL